MSTSLFTGKITILRDTTKEIFARHDHISIVWFYNTRSCLIHRFKGLNFTFLGTSPWSLFVITKYIKSSTLHNGKKSNKISSHLNEQRNLVPKILNYPWVYITVIEEVLKWEVLYSGVRFIPAFYIYVYIYYGGSTSLFTPKWNNFNRGYTSVINKPRHVAVLIKIKMTTCHLIFYWCTFLSTNSLSLLKFLVQF